MKKKRSTTARVWECWITTNLATATDEAVETLWISRYPGGKVPYGDLKQQWRRIHCRTLNPYGSESCPYPMTGCVAAFLDAVERSLQPDIKNPMGYFIKLSKSEAARRADLKPLGGLTSSGPYGNILRTGVPDGEPETQGPGNAGDEKASTRSRSGLRRPQAGPVSIGEVLGQIDPRPRQGSITDRKEGTK